LSTNPYGKALTEAERALAEAHRLSEQYRRLHSPLENEIVQAYARMQQQLRGYQSELMVAHQKMLDQWRPMQEMLDRQRELQEAAAINAFAGLTDGSLYQQLQQNWLNSPAARALTELQSLASHIDWEALWKRDREGLSAAAQEGWFLQPEHAYAVADEIFDVRDDPEKLETLFVQTLEPLVDTIIERISKRYPARRHVLYEALALYREGRYYAAIPLLLSTADGIAYEVAGQSAFSVKGKKTTLGRWVAEQPDDDMRRQYMEHLAEPHALASPTVKRKFSRHGVQHGIDVTYGSKENCLRAVSFVGFIAWLMSPATGDSTEDEDQEAAETPKA
jgi:hypothetical protein